MMATFGFDPREDAAALPHRGEHAPPASERLLQDPLALLERAVGRAGFDLVRANAVPDQVQRVARDERLQQRDEKGHRELEAGGVARCLAQAALLLEQEDAEAVESRVAQRLAVFGHVRAEPARAARPRGQEDVLADNLVDRHVLAVAQVHQVLHEIADGEVRGVALGAVAEFLPEPKRIGVGHVERLDRVAEPRDCGADDLVVREREPSEQDSRRVAVRARERLRIAIDPVVDRILVQLEPPALGLLEGFHLGLDGVVTPHVRQGVGHHGGVSLIQRIFDDSSETAGSTGSSSR